jgi:hypothetical protein
VETQTTAVCHSATGYRRLVPALGSKVARLGSVDPEAAAQEAPLRSLTHPLSRSAIDDYVHEDPATPDAPPECI